MPEAAIILHGTKLSSHAHRVELLLRMLGLPYDYRDALAKRYDAQGRWLPEEPEGAAEVQRWLSIAAGEIRHGPATARMVMLRGMAGDLARAREIAGRLLVFMEDHLAAPKAFIAADHPTIAALACYSYVAHAPEGGVPLEPYPAARAWLGRVEALPGFEPMPRSPLPAIG